MSPFALCGLVGHSGNLGRSLPAAGISVALLLSLVLLPNTYCDKDTHTRTLTGSHAKTHTHTVVDTVRLTAVLIVIAIIAICLASLLLFFV